MHNTVHIKAIDDNTITIHGWGVVFDGEDLQGEAFTKDTDFMPSLVQHPAVFYDHTMTDIKHDLGVTKSIAFKESDGIAGLWIEAQLDRSKAYVEQVKELIEKGILGWSSGSVPHLVERSGKYIKRWPIVEFSLTPTPAEPRTLGVEMLKALAEHDPNLEAFIPEERKARRMRDGEDQSDITPNKDKNMTDETKGIDYEALIEAKFAEREQAAKAAAEIELEKNKAVEDAIKATTESIMGKLEASPVLNEIGFKWNGDAPVFNKTGLGDTEVKAYAHFLRTGQENTAMKASNATDMNIATDADGGYAVPTGHYQGIIARRDEGMLAAKLGIRNIPGKGTTVNVPLDGEADGEFILTGEASAFDLDAPALGTKAMTLVKYTKQVKLSHELLYDEDSRLMAFLNDFVGRGMAKTHNSLLITEVGTNGTEFATAATTSWAFGELENIVGDADLANYMDDSGSVAWVTNPTNYWGNIATIVGSDRQYALGMNQGNERNLLGFPVHFSSKVTANAASAKSIYFGNWNFVGKREGPSFEVIRDPYSAAGSGQVILHYYFRAVYGVLQAEAIGYGTMASA